MLAILFVGYGIDKLATSLSFSLSLLSFRYAVDVLSYERFRLGRLLSKRLRPGHLHGHGQHRLGHGLVQ
jgi:hypothetical protein